MAKSRFLLKTCANGDGNQVSPPSLVICRQCQDKITAFLESQIERLERDHESPVSA